MKKIDSSPPGYVTSGQAAEILGISENWFSSRYAQELQSWGLRPRYFREGDVIRLALDRRYTRLVEQLEGVKAGHYGLLAANDGRYFIINCPECGGLAIERRPQNADEAEHPWPWLCEAGHR